MELISDVLSSGVLGGAAGVQVPRVEAIVARTIGVERVVATATGTLAFEAVIRALGIGESDDVIVPELGWVSVAATVRSVGAKVRPISVGRSCMLEPADIIRALRPHTRAVIVAHLFGAPAPGLLETANLLSKRGVLLIEDCAQAWGARIDGRHVGGFGNAAFFSTQNYKLISTGEGGFAVLQEDSVEEAARLEIGDMRFDPGRPEWRRNMRMNEFAAAAAIPQLADIANLVETLCGVASSIQSFLRNDPDVQWVGPSLEVDAEGSGAHVIAWAENREAADRVVQRLTDDGLRSWRLLSRQDDLHHANGWPGGSPVPIVDWHSLIVVPVPAVARLELGQHR